MLSGLNPLQGLRDSFGSKTFMARCAVPIRPFYDKPGQLEEAWYDLGKRDWSDEDGTVSHPTSPCSPVTLVSHLWAHTCWASSV